MSYAVSDGDGEAVRPQILRDGPRRPAGLYLLRHPRLARRDDRYPVSHGLREHPGISFTVWNDFVGEQGDICALEGGVVIVQRHLACDGYDVPLPRNAPQPSGLFVGKAVVLQVD